MITKSKCKNTTTKKPVKQVEIVLLCTIFLMIVVSGTLCYGLGYHQFYYLFVFSLILGYHLVIRACVPRVLYFVHKGPFHPENAWFREKKWEKSLYGFFRVKNWKDNLPTFNLDAFSIKLNSPESILQTMCIAETIHMSLIFLSLIFILFGFVFGNLIVFVIIGCFSIIWESRFVMAQRYNRPRIKAYNDRINSRTFKK